MKTIKYLLAVTLLFSVSLSAQQESLFTTYRYNMNLINPAYAGVNHETVFSSTFRNQWTGIKDSPQTQALSFGTPLIKNVGIGISMIYDQTFIEKQTIVGLDISYRLQVSGLTDLYLGIKAGGTSYNVNTSGLETYNLQSDPALFTINQFNPNIGIGALLKNDIFFISLSVPRLLNTERAKNVNGYASLATDKPTYYLSGGYNYNFETLTPLVLKPSVMLRYVNGAPVSVDLNTMLEIDNIFEIGGTYRINNACAGIATIKISKLLKVGYAYEINFKNELAKARNTNEFFLQFKI
ncbi:type IX secretion system membrane protein PorP/SprF [Flavobacterium sp. GSB-24]|uniref:PorP/SprF family type IX secretion system membrane protein n=1 Tax=Flavobacterium sp. GSB-24 TaxID=2994319 RepID=UPI002491FC97|nr:type IX secretion system membrane protein PorP/SprF [Flavobacterium sp. GSB-24]BDU27706.1 membrane protein [Flavobacterium sp. GSB-24]